MKNYRTVESYFLRSDWNETWYYPKSNHAALPNYSNFPLVSPQWEISFEPMNILQFSRRYYWIGPFIAFLYVLFVIFGPRLMRNRKPFSLSSALRWWNLSLCILSCMGSVRVVPQLLSVIFKAGFFETLCIPPIWTFGYGPSGFWTILFVYSKFFELMDTVFIVLRKRKLSFLHWYHHLTVLLLTWDAFIVEQPAGFFFCGINYMVHGVMYFYYYLASVSSKPLSWGIIVTVLQVTQMFMGVALTLITLSLSWKYPFLWYTTAETALKPFDVPGCYVDKRNLLGLTAMYFTYCYLFVDFFWKRYVKSSSKLKTA